MKKSTTIFTVIIAAVLIVCYGALRHRLNKPAQHMDAIVNFTQEELLSVEVSTPDEEYTLVKNGDTWSIEGIDEPLLLGGVNDYFNKTLPMKGELIENPSTPETYGMDNYTSCVTYTLKNGKKKTVTLGNQTPSETEAYVLDDKGNLYTVYTLVSNALDNQIYHFIDDYITGFIYEELQQIKIINSSGEVTLRHNDGEWIYEPSGEKADEFLVKSKITRHLGSIYALKCFKKTDENLQKYGFDNQKMRLEVTVKNGETTVINAGTLQDEYLYITVDEKPFIYCVNSKSFEFLTGVRDVLQVSQ